MRLNSCIETFFAILAFSVAFIGAYPLAHQLLRQILRQHPPVQNPYVAMVETVTGGPLAYTADDGSRIYIDSQRMIQTPNTLWNVLRHEVAHTQGGTHNDGSREMNYSVTMRPNGAIVNDDFRI